MFTLAGPGAAERGTVLHLPRTFTIASSVCLSDHVQALTTVSCIKLTNAVRHLSLRMRPGKQRKPAINKQVNKNSKHKMILLSKQLLFGPDGFFKRLCERDNLENVFLSMPSVTSPVLIPRSDAVNKFQAIITWKVPGHLEYLNHRRIEYCVRIIVIVTLHSKNIL